MFARAALMVVVLVGSGRSGSGGDARAEPPPAEPRRGGEPALTAASISTAERLPAEVVDASSQPYALTISGGVSLGSYEAGLNWALLEILRSAPPNAKYGRPTLAGTTGASAGSINALLTAMTWCRRPDDGAPDADGNLFAATWLPIGLDTLAPALERYRKSENKIDGLLSRRAFDPMLEQLRTSLQRDRFRPGCELTLGLTVTRLVPGRIQVAGLSVDNQRFVIPLLVKVDASGRIHFHSRLVGSHHKELLGNIIYLTAGGDGQRVAAAGRAGEIDAEALLDAVQSSSAFPLAFGPVRLRYWVDRRQCAEPIGAEQDGFVLCQDWFMDGGVFDNIPLGVAMAQLETSELLGRTPRPLRYLYIDPGSRRAKPVRQQVRSKRPFSADLGSWRRALGGAISTAESYELHNVLRYNLWNQGTPWLGAAADRFIRTALFTGTGQFGGEDPVAAARRGKTALEKCLGGPTLAAFEVPLEDKMPAAMSRLGDCFRNARSVDQRREYLAALGEYIAGAARRLEEARMSGDSPAARHVQLRGAVLRLVGALPEWTGALGIPLPDAVMEESNQLASHAHLLASDRGGERFLLPSRRFFPLAASHVANFGAFLDEPLRRYDYYVGIYDAIYSTATSLCIPASTDTVVEEAIAPNQLCIQHWIDELDGRLHLSSSKGAALLRQLREVESAYWARRSMPHLTGCDPAQIVFRALVEGGPCKGGYCEPKLDDDDLDVLIHSLSVRGYRPESAEMRMALRDPDRWWVDMGIRVLVRQRELERMFDHKMTAAGLFFVERTLSPLETSQYEGVYTLLASVPRRESFGWHLLRLLPHEISTSLSERRTVEGAWQPAGLAIDGGLGQWRLTSEVRGGRRDSAWFSEVGGAISVHGQSIPTYMMVSSLGAAAGYSAFGKHDGDVRLELFGTTLADRLRLAVGTNDVRDAWSSVYVTIGLSDVPGSAYALIHRAMWLGN